MYVNAYIMEKVAIKADGYAGMLPFLGSSTKV